MTRTYRLSLSGSDTPAETDAKRRAAADWEAHEQLIRNMEDPDSVL